MQSFQSIFDSSCRYKNQKWILLGGPIVGCLWEGARIGSVSEEEDKIKANAFVHTGGIVKLTESIENATRKESQGATGFQKEAKLNKRKQIS